MSFVKRSMAVGRRMMNLYHWKTQMARETWVWDQGLQKVLTKEEFLNRERPSKKTIIRMKRVKRGSWIYDRATGKLIDRNVVIRQHRMQIIKDIDPYRSVAAEKHNGKRPLIGGRRQRREFLKRNGYIELGNEKLKNNLQYGPRPGEVARDIKRALGE